MLLIHVIMLSVVTKLASQQPILPSINPQDSENLALVMSLLFASQGGTCKIIGKECCIYISDATSSVDDLDQIVKQANKNIHANQGLLSNSFQQGVENFMNSLGGWTRYIFLSLGAIAIIIMAVFALMYCCCYCSPMICHLMHQSPKPARTQQESLEYVSEKLDKTIV